MPVAAPPLTDAEKAGATFSERLICSDPNENNNKFWHGFVLSDGSYAAEFGRVGVTCQTVRKPELSHGRAQSKVEAEARKRFNYKPPKMPYTRQATVQGSKASSGGGGKRVSNAGLKNQAVKDIGGNPEVQKLVSWLADVNIHAITSNADISYDVSTGTFSTALGLVTAEGIAEARRLLTQIGVAVGDGKIDDRATGRLIGDYCQYIPTKVAARRGWHLQLFGNSSALQVQNGILDSLDASLITATTVKPKKGKTAAQSAERVFEVTLDIVADLKVMQMVKRKFTSDRGHHHDVSHLDVKRIFAVRIPTIADAFEKRGKKVGNVKQLWHGTKASNLLSILKVGLVIPPASSGHVTGRMFGDGLYFSDQSTKSLRYATDAWAHGGDTSRKFMFLCDVAMGKEHIPGGSNWSFRLPSGYNSCFAKSGRSGVANNEMIVYDTAQANLVWLIEFTRGGR